MKCYPVESTVAKSVDVEMIRHRFSPPGERSDIDSLDNTLPIHHQFKRSIMDSVLSLMNGKS